MTLQRVDVARTGSIVHTSALDNLSLRRRKKRDSSVETPARLLEPRSKAQLSLGSRRPFPLGTAAQQLDFSLPDEATLPTPGASTTAPGLDFVLLYSEAEAARQEAERASRAKDEFLATLAHELRNPMVPIAMALKLMAAKDDAAFKWERGVIERQLGNLSRIVEDLLDVARTVRDGLRLRYKRVALSEVLANAVEMTGPLFEQRHQRLRVHLPTTELYCDADDVRLAQVFSNLLSNAARYTPEGGSIELLGTRDGGQCCVVVKDTGQGIPLAVLPHVFELFFQEGQSPGRSGIGLGIGLALVKDLVVRHGGTVSARSDGPGCGSEFIVRLPLSEAPQVLPLIDAQPFAVLAGVHALAS